MSNRSETSCLEGSDQTSNDKIAIPNVYRATKEILNTSHHELMLVEHGCSDAKFPQILPYPPPNHLSRIYRVFIWQVLLDLHGKGCASDSLHVSLFALKKVCFNRSKGGDGTLKLNKRRNGLGLLLVEC